MLTCSPLLQSLGRLAFGQVLLENGVQLHCRHCSGYAIDAPTFIDGDAVQPSLEGGIAAIGGKPLERLQKRCLHGLVCEVGDELLDASYRDRAGRLKHVRYWAMRPIGGELRPDREIGAVRWFELQEAIRTATKERERHVIASLTAVAESVA